MLFLESLLTNEETAIQIGVDYLSIVYTANTTDDKGVPLYYSADKEFVLHKMMGRELVENLIKQQVELYRIDNEFTEANFYGEAKRKNFLDVVTLNAVVRIVDEDATMIGGIRKLKLGDMEMHVYNDHLAEKGIEEIRVGDFLKYGDKFYEVFDNGPNDDENTRRLGVDYEYFKTYLAHVVEYDVFSGK